MFHSLVNNLRSSMKDGFRSGNPTRDYFVLIPVWLAVSLILTTLALRNVSAPGLYYDEAVFAGLAKDFINGNAHGLHMPGTQTVQLFGRPFPLFVQSYLGAVKAWLIIPSFLVFGESIPVLRLTALFWCLIGLLFFMLWTRRLFGLPAALIAAPMLGLDPSFYFISVLDWGSCIPSFLCRLSGYYFIFLWWHDQKIRYGLVAAFLLGLGICNKIDFVVILSGCGIAVAAVYGKEIVVSIRNFPRKYMLICFGFLLGASPMALKIWMILQSLFTGRISQNEHDMLEKVTTILAMYDGSYMYRLMQVGGRFDTMYSQQNSVWTPFGIVAVFSCIFLLSSIVQRKGALPERRTTAFILLSMVFITAGVFLLPGAVRIHHATLVYPFPHLIVVSAITMLWRAAPASSITTRSIRICAGGIAVMVIVGHLLAILKTGDLMEATGGRGNWSDSIAAFCDEVKGHSELTVVSLDWGFNEQLSFLGRGVQLSEPLWDNRNIQISPDAIYLVHPPEYALFPQGLEFFRMASQQSPRNITIKPYRDRQGSVAFYAIRFIGEKAGL